MKFGLKFHQHLVAKWADDYVDYNGLRQMIRLASQREQGLPEVLVHLESSMSSFKISYCRKLKSISRREADVCAIFGLSSLPDAIPNIDTAEQPELALLLFVYQGLLREVQEVEWFGRVNETAMTKLLGKIGSGFQQANDYHRLQLQWSTLQRNLENTLVGTKKRISDIVVDLRRVSSMTRQATRPICMRAFLRAESSPGELYDWIKSDEVVAIRRYYFSSNVPLTKRQSELKEQMYSLFIAAIIMEAKEIAKFLVEFAVAEKDWSMLTDQIFFFLSTCGFMKQIGSSIMLSLEEWLVELFDRPNPFTTSLLRHKDNHGCFAIHYAAKYGLKSFVKALVRCAPISDADAGNILSRRDDDGMTPLHYAVLSSEPSILSFLLKALVDFNEKQQSKLNLPTFFGDLLLLSVRSGQDDVAKILLNHQTSINYTAPHGETALYCAAQANNLDLIKLLLTYTQRGLVVDFPSDITRWTPLMVACANGHSEVSSSTSEALKEDMIAPHLSSLITILRGAAALARQSSLVLEISAPGTEAEPKLVRLPVLEDQINQPFIFCAKNEAPLQISIRLFRRETIDSMVLLSRGNTTLDHGKVFFGEKRESMIREVSVFMMDKETMDLTGTVLLSYVVATPFAGLQQPDTSNYQRRQGDPVQIVGHRDLQITRDLEAVIFHDFSLSESGTDVAIHDVTLSQYKHASDLQEPQSITPVTIDRGSDLLHGRPQRRRAWSTGEESRLRTEQLRDRLRYTVDFQNKGFKPNTRGDFIQGSLTTLDELLVDLPEDIGFNIEMKYPRLHEAVDAGVAPVTIDINTFVDVALEKIQRLAGNRPIILSSFTPEVCILLSVKQKAYPVMFITNAGKVPMADKELRVSSLQVGVQFARLWNLAGLVFACEALLYCPRLVQFVKNAGLVCASYGLLNNEPIHARKQADAGVDILMVDRVKLVADELANDAAISSTLN
ncbi:glycerophosphoryl diester phosphodiesterase [Trichoderma gamsii]|uniref:Glycerophosphoryl diester phosphodiesterase n=1 Tax=Trichoderma gamsii TaxID=398673 RepID=A0A2P4ZLF3_9HYPO|nr:glycerophosphoryl diester phosphodiesterase [Trichoderma gamsii]PON25126.1 glycerophosphoryl diester phosphodiesterase [Trichoderma gamsii]